MLVGAERFELPTYGTQNRRATRLRYAPNWQSDSCFPPAGKAPFAIKMRFAPSASDLWRKSRNRKPDGPTSLPEITGTESSARTCWSPVHTAIREDLHFPHHQARSPYKMLNIKNNTARAGPSSCCRSPGGQPIQSGAEYVVFYYVRNSARSSDPAAGFGSAGGGPVLRSDNCLRHRARTEGAFTLRTCSGKPAPVAASRHRQNSALITSASTGGRRWLGARSGSAIPCRPDRADLAF